MNKKKLVIILVLVITVLIVSGCHFGPKQADGIGTLIATLGY